MRRLCFLLSAVLLATNAALPPLRAETDPASAIAVQVRGTVRVAHGPADILRPVRDNDGLAAGDIVETAAESGAVLVLPNGSTVALQERTRLVVTQVRQAAFTPPDLVIFDNLKAEPSASVAVLELKFGEVVVQVRKLRPESVFTLQTPVGPAGTTGAAFALAYAEDGDRNATLRLDTAQGPVRFTPADGQPVEVTTHRRAEIRARVGRTGATVEPVRLQPLDEDARARIEDRNRAAREDVNQVLQRARAMRQAPRAPDDRALRPVPPRETTRDNRPEPPRKPSRPVRPAGN